MNRTRSKEVFIAFKEVAKLKWQLWEHYNHVVDIMGNFTQVLLFNRDVIIQPTKCDPERF